MSQVITLEQSEENKNIFQSLPSITFFFVSGKERTFYVSYDEYESIYNAFPYYKQECHPNYIISFEHISVQIINTYENRNDYEANENYRCKLVYHSTSINLNTVEIIE